MYIGACIAMYSPSLTHPPTDPVLKEASANASSNATPLPTGGPGSEPPAEDKSEAAATLNGAS